MFTRDRLHPLTPVHLPHQTAVRFLAKEQPRCDRRSIVANLGESGWVDLLLDSGFQPEEPTLWIAVYSLAHADVARFAFALGQDSSTQRTETVPPASATFISTP